MATGARAPRSSRRGRTRADRLRLLDSFVVRELAQRWQGPLRVADVGYGDTPATTLSLHGQLEAAGMQVRTLGVEREPARVRAAQQRTTERVAFCEGDFDLVQAGQRDFGLVRCANVLRAYPLADVRAAHVQLGAALAPGGLLVEGTTDAQGHVATAHLWQRGSGARSEPLHYRGLVLATDGARGFSPWLLRDHLPRDLRRHVRPPEAVHALLEDWARAWQATRTREPLASFAASLKALSATRADVPFDAWLATRGIALWCPERPSARPEVFDGNLADSDSSPAPRRPATC